MRKPIAYFITFSTYGTWLHGDEQGSVDDEHNSPRTPCLPQDSARVEWEKSRMSHPPFTLDEATNRSVVLDAVLGVCKHRNWRGWVHVRTNHVHTIVIGEASPERIMNDFKAYASRGLNRSTSRNSSGDSSGPVAYARGSGGGRRYWTEHGSTRWLWSQAALEEKVDYVKNQQGIPMAYGEYQP